MGKHYKTSDICRMFHISLDSLRYYERMKLLHIARDAHNYRCFTLQDVYQLHLLQNLKKAGVPITFMKKFLIHQNISTTLHLLQKEEQLLHEKIQDLTIVRQRLQQRIQSVAGASDLMMNQVEVLDYPNRPYLIISYDEINHQLHKQMGTLETLQQSVLSSIQHYQLGHLLNAYDVSAIQEVALIACMDEETRDASHMLPKGTYLSLYYKTAVTTQEQAIMQFITYCVQHNYELEQVLVSFPLIDEHETSVKEEYITQLQIKVNPMN